MASRIIQYIRRGNNRCGLLMAEKINGETGEVSIGWSLCSRRDEFRANIANRIALGRLSKKANLTEVPTSISKRDLPKFLNRCQRYFGKDLMILANQKSTEEI